jgi:tRNA U54 and U55 pseudouridine synthase Pus10
MMETFYNKEFRKNFSEEKTCEACQNKSTTVDTLLNAAEKMDGDLKLESYTAKLREHEARLLYLERHLRAFLAKLGVDCQA